MFIKCINIFTIANSQINNFKIPIFNRIFITKPRNPDGLDKTQIWGQNPARGEALIVSGSG